VGIFVSDNRGLIYPLSIIINKGKCPGKRYLIITISYATNIKTKKDFKPKLELLSSLLTGRCYDLYDGYRLAWFVMAVVNLAVFLLL